MLISFVSLACVSKTDFLVCKTSSRLVDGFRDVSSTVRGVMTGSAWTWWGFCSRGSVEGA